MRCFALLLASCLAFSRQIPRAPPLLIIYFLLTSDHSASAAFPPGACWQGPLTRTCLRREGCCQIESPVRCAGWGWALRGIAQRWSCGLSPCWVLLNSRERGSGPVLASLSCQVPPGLNADGAPCGLTGPASSLLPGGQAGTAAPASIAKTFQEPAAVWAARACLSWSLSGRQGSPVLSAHSPHFPPLPHIPSLPLGPCIPLQKPPHLPPRLPEPPWAVLGAAWDLGRGGGHHGLSEGMKGREGQEAGSVPEDICFRWESKCLPWCLVLGPSFFLPILVSPSPHPCLTISPHPHPEPLSLHRPGGLLCCRAVPTGDLPSLPWD